jgi:tRNA modification GTPase
VTDTIAALATGSGSAAIGIVRISGPDAARVLLRVVPKTRAVRHPRTVSAGRAVCEKTGSVIDEVLCFYAPSPGTATGEDIAEIHGHGGALVMRSLLEAVFDVGARPAHPGEFTARAYRNGRMDLTQAEAVMALIGARSDRAARLAARHLCGAVGAGLAFEYERLTDVAAALEAGLDFPDEDLPSDEIDKLARELAETASRLTVVRDTYHLGARLTGGASVVICGPANAGKSSLLNRLAREERALVDEQPGTTRDIVEAHGEVDGIAVTYLDTAGFRVSTDRVEQRGMEKSRQALMKADVVLLVLDGACAAAVDVAACIPRVDCPVIIAHNKCDRDGFIRRLVALPGRTFTEVDISAIAGTGMDALEQALKDVLNRDASAAEVVLTTARQHLLVTEAVTSLERGLQALSRQMPFELVAADIRDAREALAGLWGRHAEDDVIDRIFSSFCLGK